MTTALIAASTCATAAAHPTATATRLASSHAREHALEDRALSDAARRWRALAPARRRAILRSTTARARRAAQLSVDAPAEEVGRWTPAGERIDLPGYAIHSVVLPTGKVLMWGRPPIDSTDGTRANTTPAMLWDPAHPELPPEDVTPKLDLDGDGDVEDAPVFCSGQSLLPDGRVFAAGGTLAYPDYQAGGDFKGLDIAFLFDPWTETWSFAGRMRHGRWYPSQVELADGRIAIYAGLDETGSAADNRDLEIFDWRDGSLRHVPAGDAVPGVFQWFPFYPHLFTMPGGDVLLGGPDSIQSALLDTAALDGAGADGSAWTTIGGGKDGYGGLTTYYRGYGAGVILPNAPTRAALIGGYVDQDGDKRSQRDADVIDVAAATPRWSASPDVPPMHVGRSSSNVVILPDGSLVAVGGGAGFEPGGVTAGGDPAADPGTQNAYTGRDQELKRVELLRPGTDTAWRLGPAQAKWRTYHSTAVLLPDGRVLSAGDDYWDVGDVPDPWAATGATVDEAEIYSPPYLFDGDGPAPRPAIGAAPANAPYGDVAGIPITAREAERAVLVAPAATTHANDMNQRLVELEIVSRVAGKGVNVRMPADGTLAPPGYYMLFAIDDAGTPSMAHWIPARGRRARRARADGGSRAQPGSRAGHRAGPGAHGRTDGGPGADGHRAAAARRRARARAAAVVDDGPPRHARATDLAARRRSRARTAHGPRARTLVAT